MTDHAIYDYLPRHRTKEKIEGTVAGPVKVAEQLWVRLATEQKRTLRIVPSKAQSSWICGKEHVTNRQVVVPSGKGKYPTLRRRRRPYP